MLQKKLFDSKNVNLFSRPKRKASDLKVCWQTYQGGQKKRGNPTIQYVRGH